MAVALRRDAGAAARVHGDGRFGHRRLEQQRVGHHTDVGAEADQLDLQRLLRALGHQNTGEPVGAEGGLVDNGRLLRGLGDRIVELPAVGALDAVLDGQIAALLRVEIVFVMRVACEIDVPRVVLLHLLHDARNDLLRLLRAERAVDEVVLHINDDENLTHGNALLFFQMCFHFAPFGTSVTSMPRAFSSSRMRSASAKFFAFLASAR